jgi:vacuolar-type H+-ATPase subunit C/Vma6
MIVPAGRIREPSLLELAAQPGLRAAVDLMVAWSVPSRRVARAVAAALSDYERSADPGALEALLYSGPEPVTAAPEVAAALAGEVDERNLVTALRLRQSRLDGEPFEERTWLPGGSLRPAILGRAIFTDDLAAAVAMIRESAGAPHWLRRVESWVDLSDLEARLRTARWRFEMDGFRHGDPLGAAVPVGFVAAKQSEAHDLGLMARLVVHRLEIDGVLERMVMI